MRPLALLLAAFAAACSSQRVIGLDGAVDAGCPDGLTLCDGQCVDVLTDLDHCGACNEVCDVNRAGGAPICEQGHCFHDDCAGPKRCCADAVVDVQADDRNCGDCGIVCDVASGFTCIEGSCVCTGGLTDCNGECVDTSRDLDHCGACHDVCDIIRAGGSPICEQGRCFHDDCGPPPRACCAGLVVDTSSDPNNCGDCGIECDTANGFTCINSSCQCPSGFTDCGGGQCVDLQTNGDHCGSCGCQCDPGFGCIAGECQYSCGGPLTYCPEPDCAQVMCNGGCPGQCVDTETDSNHCGGCNNECLSGSCVAGQCEGDAGVVYPSDAGVDAGLADASSDQG